MDGNAGPLWGERGGPTAKADTDLVVTLIVAPPNNIDKTNSKTMNYVTWRVGKGILAGRYGC